VSRVRVGVGVAALALGMLLLFFAHDVSAWHSTIRTASARVASAAPPALTPSTILPSGLSKSALSVSRDRNWIVAVRRFKLAYSGTFTKNQLTADDYHLLNSAESALGRVTQDSNAASAAQAYNLLAVLVFREAYPGTVVVRRLVQESLTDLQNAVRLDPGSEVAKENLELTLRVLVSVNLAPQQARTAGTHRANAKKGGYEGPPGAGY
jgi:hypothetical protein